jgi:hypothetical protein
MKFFLKEDFYIDFKRSELCIWERRGKFRELRIHVGHIETRFLNLFAQDLLEEETIEQLIEKYS